MVTLKSARKARLAVESGNVGPDEVDVIVDDRIIVVMLHDVTEGHHKQACLEIKALLGKSASTWEVELRYRGDGPATIHLKPREG